MNWAFARAQKKLHNEPLSKSINKIFLLFLVFSQLSAHDILFCHLILKIFPRFDLVVLNENFGQKVMTYAMPVNY
jgi:hypothetical protein